MARAQINHIQLDFRGQYAVYNDSDAMTDYFNSTRGTLNYIGDQVRECGADAIVVKVTNNDADLPHLRRVKRICKVSGYTFVDESHDHTYPGRGDNEPHTVRVIKYMLTRKTCESDTDCDVDRDTDTCAHCNVYHGEPCTDCGGRGYHAADCSQDSATTDAPTTDTDGKRLERSATETLQTSGAEMLCAAARGFVDLNQLAARELALRGLDYRSGVWVGFETARAILSKREN